MSLELFIDKLRSEDNKRYALILVKELSKEDRIRSCDLLKRLIPNKIPYDVTVYRLIKDLSEFNIIKILKIPNNPPTPGKTPTYYTLQKRPDGNKYSDFDLMTRTELIQECNRLSMRVGGYK